VKKSFSLIDGRNKLKCLFKKGHANIAKMFSLLLLEDQNKLERWSKLAHANVAKLFQLIWKRKLTTHTYFDSFLWHFTLDITPLGQV
jgi:hypothetical protein